MAFRKLRGRSTWHWCSNCSNWPDEDYDSTQTMPRTGKMCGECESKDERGDCE